jgi:hypothetical protein
LFKLLTATSELDFKFEGMSIMDGTLSTRDNEVMSMEGTFCQLLRNAKELDSVILALHNAIKRDSVFRTSKKLLTHLNSAAVIVKDLMEADEVEELVS